MRVRIGYVKYLNTLPLVEGLEALQNVDLVAAVPSKLGPMLGPDPQLDIALASVIDAANSPVPLTLIPAGMIGSDGPTLTVRLFSAVPIERVTTVFADTDSHTSVALLRVLLKRLHNTDAHIVDFDARERVAPAHIDPTGHTSEWPEAMLLIGDKVVTDSPPAVRYPHQLDLGEAWKRLTSLPFVYALWMCRTADVARPEIIAAASLLHRQRLRNAMRIDWLVEKSAANRRWPPDLARTYVGDLLRYQVGPREREAVSCFLEHCAALGLIADARVRWMDAPLSH